MERESRIGGGFGTGLSFAERALFAPLLAALLGLLEAVGLALDLNDLGVVYEAVDEGDDAGGIGEDLAPFGEWAVLWTVHFYAESRPCGPDFQR